MVFFGVFLDVPLPPIDWHPSFSVNKRYWGGTYLGQASFIFDLQFQSFQSLNVLKAAESSILGRFWVVFWS